MPYVLGIDVGTSRTIAAICRRGRTAWGEVETVRLGARSVSVASAVYLAPDGSVVAGDAALRYAETEPTRFARDFAGRVGDEVPIVVGSELCTAEELTALLISWVIDHVAAQESGSAEHVVVTHGAAWGAYRRGVLLAELQRTGTAEVTLLPEPIAAGESYAARDRLDVGGELAVYSLGSAVFESSVVRRAGDGTFELRGATTSVDPLGGDYFDEALIDHLRTELGHELEDLDPADPADRLAAARLHAECARAKEYLSEAVEATIPVRLPRVHTDVRVARADFEALIRPTVDSTVATLQRTVRAFAVDHSQLAAVSLVGGSSRIPLVAGLISEELRCRIAVDSDPAVTVARGAALAGRRLLAGRGVGPALPAPPSPATVMVRPNTDRSADFATDLADDRDQDLPEPPSRPAIDVAPLQLPERRSATNLVPGLRPRILGAIVVVVILVGVVLTFVFEAGTASRPTPFATTSGSGGGSGPTTVIQNGPLRAPTATLPGATNH